MARVRLICGAQRSPRGTVLDALMAEHWDHATFLVPTQKAAARRAEQLIIEGRRVGAWGRRVLTFQDFVAGLLRAEGAGISQIDEFERRLLVERVVLQLKGEGKLEVLGAAATTKGFLAHLQHVLTELKQAAVDPEEFRARTIKRSHPSPLDAVVGEVYTAYQAALRAANAYDTPGLYWEAQLLCERTRPRGLKGVATLLLDGFDDFTPAEFRLLTALAPHLDLMAFGLDCNPEQPSRRDLDAIPLKTAARLRTQFNAEQIVYAAAAPATFTEFASERLFWRDKPPQPAGLTANVELVPCSDFVQEVETIGRRVKTLLLEGVHARDIAVVYRDLRPVADTLRAVFAEFGIPAHIPEEPPLTASSIGAFVLALVQTTAAWRRDEIVDLLTSPWFSPELDHPPEHVAAFPILSRLARVVEGYGEWQSRLMRLPDLMQKKTDPELEAFLQRMPDAAEAVGTLRARLECLKSLSDSLNTPAPPHTYARRLDEIIECLGVACAVEEAVAPVRDAERSALECLRNALGRIDVWYAKEEATPSQSRAEFASFLNEILRETSYAVPGDSHGVACLNAAAARHLRFDYVFFGGANEGDLPKPMPINAIYADEDLEDLVLCGIALEGHRLRGGRELRLFHHVFDIARRRLCITWHTTARGGGARRPSPYLADVMELFPGYGIEAPAPAPAAFVPRPGETASWRDLCNTAFLWDSPLRTLFGEEFAAIRNGAAIESRRYSPEVFGPYDGVLDNTARIAELARRFDAAHLFSVNQIETYAECPFRFFVERVLDLREVETPVAEFDDLVRGQILHRALEAFHRHYAGRAVAEIPETEAQEALRGLVRTAFDQRAGRSVTAPPGVAEVEQRKMLAQVNRYLRLTREADREAAWKPTHFEVAFGGRAGTTRDGLSRSEPFALPTAEGTVRFSGRIDRIDLAGAVARIVDYKSGGIPEPKEIKEGYSIQLFVYAAALEQFLLPEVSCAEAVFVAVGKKKNTEGLGKSPAERNERAETALNGIGNSVAGIRSGQFPPTPPKKACRRCAARRACRYEASRIERKVRTADESHA